MTTNISFDRIIKTILIDVLLLVFVYFVPALSHVCALPFYQFEPMRIALFVGVLLLDNKYNSYFLAFTLPLFSFMISGHPIAMKNIIMSLELIMNVFILVLLSKKQINAFLTCFISIVVSKVLYYTLKYFAILGGLLSTTMIGTSILMQLLVTVSLSLVYMLVFGRKAK